MEHLSQKLEELSQSEVSARAELRACERQWQQAHSRLESLQELQAKLAGFDEGVRFLLRSQNEQFPDLVCTLAERIQVESEYGRAIEAALSNKLQAIVADKDSLVLQAISMLRE